MHAFCRWSRAKQMIKIYMHEKLFICICEECMRGNALCTEQMQKWAWKIRSESVREIAWKSASEHVWKWKETMLTEVKRTEKKMFSLCWKLNRIVVVVFLRRMRAVSVIDFSFATTHKYSIFLPPNENSFILLIILAASKKTFSFSRYKNTIKKKNRVLHDFEHEFLTKYHKEVQNTSECRKEGFYSQLPYISMKRSIFMFRIRFIEHKQRAVDATWVACVDDSEQHYLLWCWN